MTQTKNYFFFTNNLDMGIKNAEFDAEFKYVEKGAKTVHEERYRAKNFCTQYSKMKKYIIPTLSC